MLLKTALTLASRGLSVFPLLPRDKRPAVPGGLKAATTNPDEIKAWWRDQPDYNVGIATGPTSHVFVVDVDGDDGESALAKLEAQHTALPATVEAITGRGRHLYFEWPNLLVRNSAGKLAPGIDVRGDGGYVVAPPSMHPSGRRYVWSVDSANAFAAAPQWLLGRLTDSPQNGKQAPTPPSEWEALVRNGISEGARNASLAKLCGYLLRRHVDPLVALEIVAAVNDARCRPPLSRDEILTIANSIASREIKRRGIRHGD